MAEHATTPPNRVTDVFQHLAEREYRFLLAVREYRLALMEIVNVLGPNGLCRCQEPCEELRTEAAAALEIAQIALQRGSQAKPEGASP